MDRIKLIKISQKESLYQENDKIEVKPNQQYRTSTNVFLKQGKPYSAYFVVILLDSNDKEITRHIRWLNDFSNHSKTYSIIFTTPSNAKKLVLGYRVNHETPVYSDIEMEITPISSLTLTETRNLKDECDDITKFELPAFPPLTSAEENILEKKMVWIFAAPRSGTTWIGSQLLKHSENIIWYEPWIGLHLGVMSDKKYSENGEPTFERVLDANASSSAYFFSPYHKNNWMPALRKFILARAYSEAQTLSKNLIIKEPVGSQSSDIIMECFPNSKLLFLIRDGRDVVDSRIDMHTKNSWAGLKTITNSNQKNYFVKWYSYQWNKINERINRAYQNHNHNLRLLVKYEDLKNNTLDELKRIYDFLDIKVNDDELQEKIQIYDFKKISDNEKGKGKFFRSASTGGWKENFSKEERDLMNSIMGKTLVKFSY